SSLEEFTPSLGLFSNSNSTSFASSRTRIKPSTPPSKSTPYLHQKATVMASAIKKPFDFEDGDLTIIIMYEGKRVTGKVSTSAMMLASPVWKKFICPPWTPLPTTDEEEEITGRSQKEQDPGDVDIAEEIVESNDKDEEALPSKATKKQRTSQASESKELDFTEDDGEAFLILLRIAHLHFSKLPVQGLSLDLLLHLATMCDKYDCTRLVKPWIPLWTLDPDIKMENLEKLLFVSWVFRPQTETWNKVPLRAVERLSIDDSGVHRFSGDSSELGRAIALEQMPPGVLERLLSKRQELLGEISELAYVHLHNIPFVYCEYEEDSCVYTRWKKFIYPPFEQLRDSETPTKRKAAITGEGYQDLTQNKILSQPAIPKDDQDHTQDEQTIDYTGFGAEDGGQQQREEQANAEVPNTTRVAEEKPSNDEPPTNEILQIKQKYENTMAKDLDFSDDDGDALLLLLHIVHLQFRYIPPQLDFPLLLQVAVLCDMYDCVQLVQPWLEAWLEDELDTALQPGHEQWLFIAWVFGRENIFNILARKLMEEVEVDKSGRCRVSTGYLKEHMPPGILGKFKL
ncbi:hypothetical protein LSUB1_G006257, partial [Lachnellula subtilissima]